jgi:RNA polymerase sigma-70 factor (ECF subfamily)
MSPQEKDFNSNDEAYLIKRVLHGDMDSFKQIIIQNQKLVASIVFKMVQQQEDREDLCQEIFLKVYDKLSTFKFHSKLSTWIAHIGFNHCANFLKKNKTILIKDIHPVNYDTDENMPQGYVQEIVSYNRNPDQQILNKELNKYLLKSIESLSIIQKTIVHLFHQNEFSLDEIATITALPVNTVKSHLFRARTILKSEMLKYLNH